MEWVLLKLKEFAEGDMQPEEWERWWKEHQEAIEPLFTRRVYLLLKKRPLLFVKELLSEHNISCNQQQFQCPKCGAWLFRAVAGVTTADQIVAFASRCHPSFRWRERILKQRWIWPGLYCPQGCIYNVNRDPYTPSAEELFWQEANQKAFEEEERLAREKACRNPWGERVCTNCGKRLKTWGDSSFRCCGYCRHPLEIPPEE